MAGPTSTKWPGNGCSPTRAEVANTITRYGENSGSKPGSVTPALAASDASCARTQPSTPGSAASGRVSSIAPGTRVAQGRPYRCAVSGPAIACWSVTTTSGSKAATARFTAGSVKRAIGMR
jgi:hypothetical protein